MLVAWFRGESMNEQILNTDYLVVGSGAVAMAFVDVIVNESQSTVMMLDRHHGPGGHWNDAYPFVRLHQPSAYYGVNSKSLGNGGKDLSGLNAGSLERATGSEMVAYYEQVMQGFLASGQVRYHPMCDYTGDFISTHTFCSLTSTREFSVDVNKKIVDTTYLKTAVPSTHPPKYAVAPYVRIVSVNELSRMQRAPTGYCVVGSGKTGIDACLWLLENGVAPESICWIMPRDAWYQNRANVQPGLEFFENSFGAVAKQYEAVGQASSLAELLQHLNDGEVLLRLDDNVEPSMYHGAVMSHAELAALRRIKNVVRLGRVKQIALDCIELEKGVVPADPDWLYVDCSARGVAENLPVLPVFDGPRITPQFVRSVQPAFSASLVAHVELQFDDDREKNEICTVVPIPDQPADWLRMFAVNTANQQLWRKVEGLPEWIAASRLDWFSSLVGQVDANDQQKVDLLQRFALAVGPAVRNIPRLLETASMIDVSPYR
jgi:hypothetical protein